MGDLSLSINTDRMPHICGPHSQLTNCRYHDQRRQQEAPTTTWVPIPIHKVQEVTEESEANNFNSKLDGNLPYHVQQPRGGNLSSPSSSGGVSRSVPIQLASPNLIMRAGKQQTAVKDQLFPRKKKSEFTVWAKMGFGSKCFVPDQMIYH